MKKKNKILSIICFSLAAADLAFGIANIAICFFAIANEPANGLPASTAFLLAIPYGLIFIIFITVAIIQLRKCRIDSRLINKK